MRRFILILILCIFLTGCNSIDFKTKFNRDLNNNQNLIYGFEKTDAIFNNANVYSFNLSNSTFIDLNHREEINFTAYDKYVFYKDSFAIVCYQREFHNDVVSLYDIYNITQCRDYFLEFIKTFKKYVQSVDSLYYNYYLKNKKTLFIYSADRGTHRNRGIGAECVAYNIDSDNTVIDMGYIQCFMHEAGHSIGENKEDAHPVMIPLPENYSNIPHYINWSMWW